MAETITAPNWELVTDHFQEPTTCKELATLLTPIAPTVGEQSFISLSWKKKEFYKKENILSFLSYGEKKLTEMSVIDKDHFEVTLRMMRMYREIGDNESAYRLAEEKEITSFIQTSLHFPKWDILTKTVALSYLVTKYKIHPFGEEDHQIFHRAKLSTEWMGSMNSLLTHKELFSLYLWYIRMFGNHMGEEEIDDHLMGVAVYLTNHFADLFNEETAFEYCQWVHMFSQLSIKEEIIHIHRALCTHMFDLLDAQPPEALDDYNLELKEVLENANAEFLHRYNELIGKLLSYIPYYEKYSTRMQLRYFESLLLSFIDAKDGQVELIQHFVISQLVCNFGPFINILFKHKKVRLIESILCDWLSVEDHQFLNQAYEMEILYTTFGKG